jgi:hypothetical protein
MLSQGELNVSRFLALLNALLTSTQLMHGGYLGVNYEGDEFRSEQTLYLHFSHQVQSFEYGTTKVSITMVGRDLSFTAK